MNNKKTKIIIILIILIIMIMLVIGGFLIISNNSNRDEEIEEFKGTDNLEYENENNKSNKNASNELLLTSEDINIVPTMSDTITTDSSWCGTFQLVWNDMKNKVVKKDIEFSSQLEMVDNLNKEEFTEDMISEEYYYKTFGLKNSKLKEEIKKGIKEKFDEESDILDRIDWATDDTKSNIKNYFFYAMLYREFEFLNQFDKLDNDKFGSKYDNVEYFGIDDNTNKNVGNQITVLYYNSKDDFAISIDTKNSDEVIFCKNPKGSTFNQIYENMKENAENYNGTTKFQETDIFKAPNIKFDENKEYDELENKEFTTADGDKAEIQQAIQTIQFELNEKGGKVKSEAGISAEITTAEPEEKAHRYFYIDNTFALFLKEKERNLPYFATRIEDITKIQENATEIEENNSNTKKDENTLKSEFNNIFTNDVKNYKDKYKSKKEKSNEDIVFTDYAKKEDVENSYSIDVKIPYINVKEETIEKFNENISKTFKNAVDKILDTRDKGYIYEVNYGSTIENDILSVIIKATLQQGGKSKVVIKTYNYSLTDEKEVKLEDILKLKNIEISDVQNKIDKEIQLSQKKAEQLKELGHEVFERDLNDDMYKVQNVEDFYYYDGCIYIVFAYTISEKDIVVIR